MPAVPNSCSPRAPRNMLLVIKLIWGINRARDIGRAMESTCRLDILSLKSFPFTSSFHEIILLLPFNGTYYCHITPLRRGVATGRSPIVAADRGAGIVYKRTA